MRIIVGLGNPGWKYKNTRHNAGFNLLDEFAGKYKCPVKKKGFGGLYAVEKIFNKKTVLFKPLTYMNLSGQAVKAVYEHWSPHPEDVLIVLDDFSIPLGKIRIRPKGSDGGHNGLRSIKEEVNMDFPRLRIGIAGNIEFEDKHSFVLSRFNKSEKKILRESLLLAEECVETWMKSGIKKAMNEYN